MASLTIRNLDDNVKALLRLRAAQHGRSMEEEARQILRQTLGLPRRAAAWPIASAAGLPRSMRKTCRFPRVAPPPGWTRPDSSHGAGYQRVDDSA